MAFCNICGASLGDMDLFCNQCGAKKCTCGAYVSKEAQFCNHCGAVISNNRENTRIGYSDNKGTELLDDASKKAKEMLAQRKEEIEQKKHEIEIKEQENIKSNFVTLSENEVVVKKYECTLVQKTLKGFLTVTNKRIIFHGKSSASKIVQEIPIKSVGAINSYYGKNINFKQLILGAIIALLGIFFTFKTGYGFGFNPVGLIVLLFGGIVLYNGYHSSFFLSIFSTEATNAPIQFGKGPTSLLGNSAVMVLEGNKGKDADELMSEIGALVMDLQQQGDIAIEKWSR